MTKAEAMDLERARESFRNLKPGDTIYTIYRSISRSGMQAKLSVLMIEKYERADNPSGSIVITHPNWSTHKLTGMRLATVDGQDCIVVNGCGFNRGEAIADQISYALFGKEGQLKHEYL